MTNTLALPSTAQTDYINSLLASREVPQNLRDAAAKVTNSREASMVITALRPLPWKRVVRPAAKVSPEYAEYLAALDAAEVSKYAVPTRHLAVALPEYKKFGDLLFLEIRRYKGKKYFSRLSGAPGAFARYRIGRDDAMALLSVITGNHVEFARLFGEKFVCCGRCAAPLTDQKSRETHFGPDCRKIFGIK